MAEKVKMHLKLELTCPKTLLSQCNTVCYHALSMDILPPIRKFTGTTQDIKVISVSLNVKANLILCGLKIWNGLPNNLKQAKSLNQV